tara:strand:+ start:124 stop:1845 length:1722 start_codon:yes stop_codon:yes gene_type:complete
MDKKNIITLFFISIFLVGPSQDSQSTISNNLSTKDKQVDEVDKKFIHFYFQAEKNKLLEEYNEALIAYEKCISLIPEEPAPYYYIAKLYLYIFQDIDNAKHYINEAITLSPDNEWYYYELLSIYSIEKNLIGQLNIYYKLIDFNPDNIFYYLEAINLLVDLKKYGNAVKFIKKTQKKLGVSNELLLALKDVYLAENNFKEAEKVGKKLTKRSLTFFSTLAEIYMHFNDYDNAITAYSKLLQGDSDNPKAIIALHAIYSNKEDIASQEKYLLKIAENDQINIEIKKEIFYNLLLSNQYKTYPEFNIIIERAISLHPKEPLFNLMLGDIFAKEGESTEAIKHYYLSLNSGIIKDDYIYTKLIELYWQKELTDSVIEVSEIAIDRFPFTPMFYYYHGVSLSNKGEYELSINTLLKGKDFIFDNELLVSDFYSLIGNSYHELNNHISSDEAYETALDYNPNNTYVLNNYSYYLSGREEKLLLAKEMIIKCIELTINEPNPSFIDTYAWILYKLGEYKLARTEIEKAIELGENSSVILDHYGDILYALGLVDQAKLQWEKAYELDTEDPKIKKKLKIE